MTVVVYDAHLYRRTLAAFKVSVLVTRKKAAFGGLITTKQMTLGNEARVKEEVLFTPLGPDRKGQ